MKGVSRSELGLTVSTEATSNQNNLKRGLPCAAILEDSTSSSEGVHQMQAEASASIIPHLPLELPIATFNGPVSSPSRCEDDEEWDITSELASQKWSTSAAALVADIIELVDGNSMVEYTKPNFATEFEVLKNQVNCLHVMYCTLQLINAGERVVRLQFQFD